MSRMKMAAKHSKKERPPSSSSSEEEDPQIKRIDRCPVLLGKNVDLASFTFDAPFFHIEELFGGKEIDEDEDEPSPRPRSNTPSSSTSGFTFIENHYNMLNGRIDSLTSTAEGLRNSMVTLKDLVADMTSLLHALHSRLDAVLPLYPPPED
ncbi:hypothetical protein Adt_03250 [Abeliophyllum distichum]|uniref:Uncharacterized protein n=1 Tax=Abeliophyllum distichum TaxID=126358 RepID=A0ABD1VY76_9LAMI